MVPVRKPGRPLSACPHPASRRPCSCAQVTAAIPRKQKCGCGPTTTTQVSQPKAENGDGSSESAPQSPQSKSSGSGYRIRKSASKNGTTSRRPSAVAVGLERTDPAMLNLLPSLNGLSQYPTTPLSAGSPYANVHMTPTESHYGPMIFPQFQPQMPPPMLDHENGSVETNGHSESITNAFTQNQPEEAAPRKGSCCGGGNKTAPTTTTQAPAIVPLAPKPAMEIKTKSCCSSGINSPKPEPMTDPLTTPDAPTPGSVMMSPFHTPMMMPNGLYTYYPQPTVFTYPPQYGSFLHPLQPDQWRQIMASTNFAPPGVMSSPYGIPGPIPYHPQGTPHIAGGTSHQCSCGASCQCIGCAAHPYNEATQNYVRSAWQSMTMDAQRVQAHGTSPHVHANDHTNGDSATLTNGSMTQSVSGVGAGEGTISPTAPQTPSEATSGLSEEQALSANDFFFVSYAFGDSCAGEMASCPCGDDCQCLGCTIHNNPGPVEETSNDFS